MVLKKSDIGWKETKHIKICPGVLWKQNKCVKIKLIKYSIKTKIIWEMQWIKIWFVDYAN